MPSHERILKVICNIHMTYSSNQLEIVFLLECTALAVVVGRFQEKRYRRRVFPRPHHLKRRGCAPCLPPSVRRRWWPQKENVDGATLYRTDSTEGEKKPLRKCVGLEARENTTTTAVFDALKAFGKPDAAGMETPGSRPREP